MEQETTLFAIPSELQILQKKIPRLQKIKTIDKIREFEFNMVKNQSLTFQKMEREKTFFRMFLNIKKRYKHNPAKFIKLFKLYLNQMPSFQTRYNFILFFSNANKFSYNETDLEIYQLIIISE